MAEFGYDLAVAYRVYPKPSSNPPPVFADDKFGLVQLCFESFRKSLGGLRVKLWVLLNGCPPQYETYFRDTWPAADLEFCHYHGVAPGTTVHEQYRILAQQSAARLTYFAEDDYFYLANRFPEVVQFLLDHDDADFATAYEHPDLRTTDLHAYKRPVRSTATRCWSACLSTTHTFLAKRASLLECRPVFEALFKAFHDQISPDLAMWMALTKYRVFNPFRFARWAVRNRFWAGSIVWAWWYCWRQILLGRRFTLWAPHPSIASHMVASMMATGVDWNAELQAFEKDR